MKITESFIQQECYMWFNNNYCMDKHFERCLMFSISNEMAMAIRSVLIGLGLNRKLVDEAVSIIVKKMKNTGFTPGVSDTVVCLPNGVSLFIEFKTPTGCQSPEQDKFEKRLKGIGHNYYLCSSFDDFKSIIKSHTF